MRQVMLMMSEAEDDRGKAPCGGSVTPSDSRDLIVREVRPLVERLADAGKGHQLSWPANIFTISLELRVAATATTDHTAAGAQFTPKTVTNMLRSPAGEAFALQRGEVWFCSSRSCEHDDGHTHEIYSIALRRCAAYRCGKSAIDDRAQYGCWAGRILVDPHRQQDLDEVSAGSHRVATAADFAPTRPQKRGRNMTEVVDVDADEPMAKVQPRAATRPSSGAKHPAAAVRQSRAAIAVNSSNATSVRSRAAIAGKVVDVDELE